MTMDSPERSGPAAAPGLDTDVIVVGAGPVGLMLAAELRLGGAEVIALERRDAPTTESRASTLHARTMEILDSRGLLDALGTPPREPIGHFGGITLDLTLPSAYPGQWKVPQTRTEELLQDWALTLGADLRRGHELLGLSVADDHVEARTCGPDGTRRVRGRFLVACDGEDSTVRTLTGAAFPGHDARRELLRADVDGITVPNRRFERRDHGLAIAARRGDGVTRVMAHAFGTPAAPRTGAPDFAEVAEVWKRVTGEDVSGGTPLWVNSFGDANRQLEHYRDGRVLYAGDAAHRQMPSGGQALNLGLQDAFNLGWKLALELGPTPPDELLDTYHSERHTVGRRVLANIRAQATLLLGGPEVEPVRTLLAELIGDEVVRTYLAGMISGLDITYEVCKGEHPLLGARVPETELATGAGITTTTQLLREGRGLLLNLSGDARPRPREAAGCWSGRVVTVAARPEPGGPLDGAELALIRPDGHLAWAGADEAGAYAALRRWFGPPAARPGADADSGLDADWDTYTDLPFEWARTARRSSALRG